MSQRGGEVYRGAFPEFTLHGYLSAHQADQAFTNGQAKSRSLMLTAISFDGLGKRQKKGREFFIRDTDARVRDGKKDSDLPVA